MVMDATLKTVRYGRDKLSQHEETAVAAIDAGMLAERTASGVQPHAGGAGQPVMFCKERRSAGMEFGDTFEVDRPAMVVSAAAGAGLNGLLATGQTVSHGDRLVSAGDGTLTAFDGAGGDVADDVVATVDMGEQATNRPSSYGGDTQVDNSSGSAPVAVPLEVV